jgi:hypothetical protein
MKNSFEVMLELKDEETRLKRLCDLINRKGLLELSESHLFEVQEFIIGFALRAGGIQFRGQRYDPSHPNAPTRLSAPELYEMQQTAASGVRQAILFDDGKSFGNVGWRLEIEPIVRHTVRGRENRYHGALRTIFLLAVADVMAADHEKKIAVCRKATCEKFFVRSGRSKYCSRSCADAARQRRWRTKENS